jgi:hypothetical protein
MHHLVSRTPQNNEEAVRHVQSRVEIDLMEGCELEYLVKHSKINEREQEREDD